MFSLCEISDQIIGFPSIFSAWGASPIMTLSASSINIPWINKPLTTLHIGSCADVSSSHIKDLNAISLPMIDRTIGNLPAQYYTMQILMRTGGFQDIGFHIRDTTSNLWHGFYVQFNNNNAYNIGRSIWVNSSIQDSIPRIKKINNEFQSIEWSFKITQQRDYKLYYSPVYNHVTSGRWGYLASVQVWPGTECGAFDENSVVGLVPAYNRVILYNDKDATLEKTRLASRHEFKSSVYEYRWGEFTKTKISAMVRGADELAKIKIWMDDASPLILGRSSTLDARTVKIANATIGMPEIKPHMMDAGYRVVIELEGY